MNGVGNQPVHMSNFVVVGINYKKSDAAVRGMYAISNDQYAAILEKALSKGIRELFVISTCNRTELYGFVDQPETFSTLLCEHTQGDLEQFKKIRYVYTGRKALQHLFKVGAGLDSQILGDYEIVGQLKMAAKFSKERNAIGPYLERMMNAVLQSSKEIKNTTALSGGTVSVSFAAIQFIKERVIDIAQKNILLVGTGKIGTNTCKNLVDYLGTQRVTLVNRTDQKALELANSLGLRAVPHAQLQEEVCKADVIVVATNGGSPVVMKSHLEDCRPKLLIDLSIPYNIDPAIATLEGFQLVNVDTLSKIKDETLQKRISEIPAAEAIIAKHLEEFMEWHKMRKHVPVLKAVKTKLLELHQDTLFTAVPMYEDKVPQKDKIQKVINGMAVKMREQDQKGCYYIEAINEYIATGTI